MIRGWKIVCPDGAERHPTYMNEGDADCDAGVLDIEPERCEGCPGGEHTVVECEHDPPRMT